MATEMIEHDCDDCKYNPNAQMLDDVPPRCWNCVNGCGVKELFEPMVDTSQPKEETPTVPVSALSRQHGGSHYKDLKIQPVQYAVANKFNPMQTLALRYLTRKKGGNAKVIDDRRKAIHVLEMEIEMIENGDITFE